MPDKIYAIDSLPLTSNGKIDNKKLKESFFVKTEPDKVGEAIDVSCFLIFKKAILLTFRVPLREIDNSSLF